jgi:DNA-directed RNA polymerase specialized sigma24 family protein
MSEPAVVAAEQDHRSIDGRQLRTMMASAAYHARRVARTMRLGDAEREDVEQDILLALLERRRFFDASRGAWSSFAERVARQVAQGLADAIGADRRTRAGSLDGPRNESETAALRTTVENLLVSRPDFELSLSVAQFVQKLPPELALVARLLLHEEGEIAEAQRRSGLASSEFFRRLREIRVQLVCAEIVRKRLSPDDKAQADRM